MSARLTALDFIAGCLSVESGSEFNGFLQATIDSRRLNWQAVIEVANNQLVTPALWVALKMRGLSENLPPEISQYLRALHRLNTSRNEHLRAQAIETVGRLNAIGIEPVLLKGSASLLEKTFDDPGSRVMADLDIMVPKKDAETCWNLLHTSGYAPINSNFDYAHHHHLKPLHRPGNYGVIEVHRDLLCGEAAHVLPTRLVWKNIEPVKTQGISFGVLTPTYRTLHNVLHSALMDERYVRADISLRALHELAVMQTKYPERIDWETIHRLATHRDKTKLLRAWVYLCHKSFGSPLPTSLGTTLGTKAHYLRTRLRARWNWTGEITDRLLWFSAQDICRRYKCNNDFLSLGRGRVRLATSLTYKSFSRSFRWVGRQCLNKL